MKYILINPVVSQMYPSQQLDSFLHRHGFERVFCEVNWGEVVLKKYEEELRTSQRVLVDMRCPLAADFVAETNQNEALLFPKIEPILIHCAREIGERETYRGSDKIVITPCVSLAEYGNGCQIKDTVFYSWWQFLELLGEDLGNEKQEMTPIPLGFFKGLSVSQESISGEKEIAQFFREKKYQDLQLVEVLFCKDGCHNGDGVLRNE